MTQIPYKRQTVSMDTGGVTSTDAAHMTLLPCDTSDGQCPECAIKHEPDQPHNAHSLYYQYRFYGQNGYWPNWGNAMDHCHASVRDRWKLELVARGASLDALVPRRG